MPSAAPMALERLALRPAYLRVLSAAPPCSGRREGLVLVVMCVTPSCHSRAPAGSG